MLRIPHIGLVTGSDAQAAALERLLQGHAVLTHARSICEFLNLWRTEQFDALFCEWSFGSGDWKEDLQVVRLNHPALPVIFLAGDQGQKEWVEVIEAGAFDLLTPPYNAQSLLAVMAQAAASYDAGQWHVMTPRPAA